MTTAGSMEPKPKRDLGTTIWKTFALIAATIVAIFASNTAGWNGGAWLLGPPSPSEGLDGFLNHAIVLVAGLGCVAAGYFAFRIAKWALWLLVPIMLYFALVAGIWNGIASGFDATRLEVIQQRYADAYALKPMSDDAADLTCNDARITLAEDAKALCAALSQLSK